MTVSYQSKRDPQSGADRPAAKDGKSLAPLRECNEKELAFAHAYARDPETKGNITASARKADYGESNIKNGKIYEILRRPHVVVEVNRLLVATMKGEAPPPVAISDDAVIAKGILDSLAAVAGFDPGSLWVRDPGAPGGMRMKDLSHIDTRCLEFIEFEVLPAKGLKITVKPVKATDRKAAAQLWLQAKGRLRDTGPTGGKVQVNFNFPPGMEQPKTVVVEAQ